MAKEKKYSGDTDHFEAKLARVMNRLGVETYQCDWMRTKGNSSCFVEMQYKGTTYRFENSVEKSKASGRNLFYVSDLLASIVYSLEGLARAVEQGIFTLDMLLAGVPALPEKIDIEPCFAVLGFTAKPETKEQVKEQFRNMAKVMHPDSGGSEEQFQRLVENYEHCLNLMDGGSLL